MDRESRWLNSDSQILARVKRSSAKEGTLFSLTMPWGEELQAVLEKVDAASAQQFCNLARNTYDARKDEQEAKQARAAYDKEIRDDEEAAPERSEAPAPALEEGVDLLDVDLSLGLDLRQLAPHGVEFPLDALCALGSEPSPSDSA